MGEKLAVKCDSGGFQNMNSDMNPVKQVYDLQKETGSDIYVQLDYPLFPLNSEAVNFRRIDKTLKNLEELLDISDGCSILPTVHGYNEKMINHSIKGVIDILGEEPTAVSIGSLVLVSSGKGSINMGGKKKFVDILFSVREKLPDTFIHVLRIGGKVVYRRFLLC